MKFINDQSTFAGGWKGLVKGVGDGARHRLVQERATHSDQLSTHMVIGTSGNWAFPVFASLPNT